MGISQKNHVVMDKNEVGARRAVPLQEMDNECVDFVGTSFKPAAITGRWH